MILYRRYVNLKINYFIVVAIETYIDGVSAKLAVDSETKQTSAASQDTVTLGNREGAPEIPVHFQIGMNNVTVTIMAKLEFS